MHLCITNDGAYSRRVEPEFSPLSPGGREGGRGESGESEPGLARGSLTNAEAAGVGGDEAGGRLPEVPVKGTRKGAPPNAVGGRAGALSPPAPL